MQAAFARGISRLVQWPAWSAFGLLGLLFGVYLYTNSYSRFYYDAGSYWYLAGRYWASGQFHFQSFDSSLRGYLFPLLLSPLFRVASHWAGAPIALTRALGLGTAAALFGVVGPALWQALSACPTQTVSLGRRLLFGLLGFGLWRGYFNFPLTDFPALLLLLSGLWAGLRGRSVVSGLLAGLAVAAAANFRPIYVAALPLAAGQCLWPHWSNAAGPQPDLIRWARGLAFGVGMCLVMAPQLFINQVHFGVTSPLVLTARPNEPNLYFALVHTGLYFQKYETNVGTDYPTAQVFFADAEGRSLLSKMKQAPPATAAQHLRTAGTYSMALLRLLMRHAFNGLDVQYPTPYVQKVYTPSWGLAPANYTVIITGFFVLLRLAWRRHTRASIPAGLVLLAILAPCAALLPVVMECRFLMPLQLLLCAAVAFDTSPLRSWRAASTARRATGALLYGGMLLACFAASSSTQRQLVGKPRLLFDWQKTAAQPEAGSRGGNLLSEPAGANL